MRRAIYEWGAIFSATASLACFVYWALSLATDVGDSRLYLPFGRFQATQVTFADGAIAVGDHPNSELVIAMIVDQGMAVLPRPQNTHRIVVPGFSYRALVHADGTMVWTTSVSLLLPALLLLAIAAVCIYRYRLILKTVGNFGPKRTRSDSLSASTVQ